MQQDKQTDLFVSLTPDAVLNAIEASGVRCGNACNALNSFENRVYEVELADADRTRRVAKFYRPHRWTAAQIREEHAFLRALDAAEVPVCNVLELADGDTVASAGHILFCLFERRGGRAPEEIDVRNKPLGHEHHSSREIVEEVKAGRLLLETVEM